MSFKSKLLSVSALALALAALACPAYAAKAFAKPTPSPVDAVASAPALSAPSDGMPAFRTKQAGDINVRVRGLGVITDESGEVTNLAGTPLGLNAQVSSEFVPELDISYFFTKYLAAELVLATSRHDVDAVTAGGARVPVGKVSLLPPTLTVQYHPLPDNRFSPYFGAGINYSVFYGEDAAGGTITSTSYDDSVGYAFQAGMDVAIAGNWSLNVDFKKLFVGTTVNGDGTIGKWQSDVDLNPVLVGFGVGYRF